MSFIVVIAFLLFVTVVCVGVYRWVKAFFPDLAVDTTKEAVALHDTVGRLGIQIKKDFGVIDDVHLGRVVMKVSAALGSRQNRDCLAVTTLRGKQGHFITTVCFDLEDTQDPDTNTLAQVLEQLIQCSEQNCNLNTQENENLLLKATKLSWRTHGFTVQQALGEVYFPGLVASRYFKTLVSSESVTTAPVKSFSAYIGERDGIKFLLGQTGRYENTISNIETAQRIDIVIPIKALRAIIRLLAGAN